LASRLAPERHVRLELAAPVGAEAFAGLGRLDSCCDCEVNLRVQPDELTAVVAQLLERFEVRDLEVNDPPIDQLIGDLFRQGSV
jgi:ABC-2 type transport system ATP-binding protein